MNLYAQHQVDRMLMGIEIPAGVFQSANPFFIIVFGTIVGAYWIRRAYKGKEVSSIFKMAVGTIIMGSGFFMMTAAAVQYESYGAAGMYWLILAYFLHTIGELTLSPVGLSMTTKLAPRKFGGQMMGVWFIGAALGNLIAGLFAGNFDEENVQQMPQLFWTVVMFTVGSGVLFLVFSKWVKRWMGGVE